MPYIESEQEAIEQSIKILKAAHVSKKDLKIHDHTKFSLCSNAYYRKQKCAYASVCDCCVLIYDFGEWDCLSLIKVATSNKDKFSYVGKPTNWREDFVKLLEKLKERFVDGTDQASLVRKTIEHEETE